jgi:putative membrane protein
MAKLLIRLLISAAAVYLAQLLSHVLVVNGWVSAELVTVDGFTGAFGFAGGGAPGAAAVGVTTEGVIMALVFAVVLGILNALIRPILLLLTCPITLLTLGLFVLVVNAVVFYLAASLVNGVHVNGFLGAFFGSLVVTACSTVADQLLEDKKD